MPTGNPLIALYERITAVEATVTTLNARVVELETTVQALSILVEQLKQNQLKWAPPFRFSMPPLQA